jgi:tetratricopeptide (TPR) repeat protein
VQDEIIERVVTAIEPELYAAENIRGQRKPPESLDAWECVIRALTAIGQGTPEANIEAEALCRRAIAIAPGYGQAHSLLAWALLRRTIWSGDLQTVMPEITAEAQTALALDARDPWAYMAQGLLLNRLRRFDDAARALRRALELNPNFAPAYAILALVLAFQGAFDEANDSAQHALGLSPNDRNVGLYAWFGSANAQFAVGRYTEAAASARLAIEKGPVISAAYLLDGGPSIARRHDCGGGGKGRIASLAPRFFSDLDEREHVDPARRGTS